MCLAPTCHVTNVRPSIDSPHLAVIPHNMPEPEYQCLWFQFYRASNFYCVAIAAIVPSSPSFPLSAADCSPCVSVAVASEMSSASGHSAENRRKLRGDPMELRGSRRRFGMSTEEDLGREDSTSSDRRAYIRSVRYKPKTTPHIKWREK